MFGNNNFWRAQFHAVVFSNIKTSSPISIFSATSNAIRVLESGHRQSDAGSAALANRRCFQIGRCDRTIEYDCGTHAGFRKSFHIVHSDRPERIAIAMKK
jgi:hypothetical protein